ncbi:hypothetical protein AMS68_005484 [Peltaster fructicola]|uniref:Rad21/Rec8-like protein N-terminal domain-containing protein n=1 Tax=Peltaster fructicola TaxID=286661 RepID=A0A6H0XYY9_9PEZI|nr:hypothetical protein AMS68_005484 [Peltaster fructicola]
MFYSHEVLTSRKYGFATVWLVATMGSGTKKVTRKAILDVDVVKTCGTIAAPSVPLALRLQSSLLYGITRVYAQQCGFVLQDVENARNQMRAVLKSVHTSGLNAEGTNKVRSDHLILGDDPSFLPDFDLTLADLALTFDDEQFSYLTRTTSLPTSNARHTPTRARQLRTSDGLQLGSLHSPSSAVRLSDMLTRRASAAEDTPRRLARRSTDQLPQYQGLQDDLGLMLGDDDEIAPRELAPSQDLARMVAMQPRTEDQQDDFEHNDLSLLDDGYMQQVSGTSSEISRLTPQNNDHDTHPRAHHVSVDGATKHASISEQLITTSETAQAPLRPYKNKKAVPLDQTIELSRRDLKAQQDNYLATMQQEVAHKQILANIAIAKKNAAHWMFGQYDHAAAPLSIFSGMPLLSMIADIDFGESHKRTRDETPQPELARRVRSKDGDDADLPAFQDDGYMPDYNEIEQGREQPTPLEDMRQSTLLPWNQSTGSCRPGSSHAGMSMGFDRPRFSSMRGYTASPPGTRALQASLDPSSMSPAAAYSLGKGALQGATESQWLRSALHDESMNFRDFVEDAIRRREEELNNDEIDWSVTSIDFEELLSTTTNSFVVAAQAFLHVLVLGTKNLLQAEQDIPSGSISIRLL